jgi:hypothetical protein
VRDDDEKKGDGDEFTKRYVRVVLYLYLLDEARELLASDIAALESLLDVAFKVSRPIDHQLRRLLVQRIIRVGLLRPSSPSSAATPQQKFRGGNAARKAGLVCTRKRVMRPKMTEPKLSTGIQSARRMLRQT